MISLTAWLFRTCDLDNCMNPRITDQVRINKTIDSYTIGEFHLYTTIYGNDKWGESNDIKIFNGEAVKHHSMFKELIRYHLYEKGICDSYKNYFKTLDYMEGMIRAYNVVISVNHLTFFVKQYTDETLKLIQYLRSFCSDQVYVFEGENPDKEYLSMIHNPYEFMSKIPVDNFGTISFSFIKTENPSKLQNEVEGFTIGINNDQYDINIKTDSSDKDIRNKAHILVNTLRDLRYPIPTEERFSNQELLPTMISNH